jgi:hypothetical protein
LAIACIFPFYSFKRSYCPIKPTDISCSAEGQAFIATYTTKDWAIEATIKPTEILGSTEGQAFIATYTTKDWASETPIKPRDISCSAEGQAFIAI